MFNAAVEGVDAKIVIHVCWGNYGGTPGYLPESPEAAAAQMQGSEFVFARRQKGATTNRAEAIFPRSHKVNISAINFEMGHFGMQDLQVMRKNDWEKDFIAGIIDVKNLETETADEVAERIRTCLEVIPPERLGLTTDCGMINLPRMVCQSKLQALVEGAAIVRQEIAG
jgi:5-methyltetrahydropteroyltriglutamate--homocysteine methyltransferase